MRVLWFEVCIPQKFINDKAPIGGWQDSLELLVRKNKDIELGIAFEGKDKFQSKIIDGVYYFPIKKEYTLSQKFKNLYTWEISKNHLLPKAIEVINEFKPDIIHVFGSEWCWGQVAKFTKIPVVIHMQGSIPPYNNAEYPPNYNIYDVYFHNGFNLKKNIFAYLNSLKMKSWKLQEEETLKTVSYYMGRTNWDKSIVELYNPKAKYFYCSEALRPDFINSKIKWHPHNHAKIQLITTGCGSLWKGIDTIIKTAHLLKERGINFEWKIVGSMPTKDFIEDKEKLRFEEQNIKLLGFINADKLVQELISSDIYIHTAYIDNSPNSICEAQYLGVPIIATYVGGIPSLIENNVDGILIPANAPYTLANSIINLIQNQNKQCSLSKNAIVRAENRHNPKQIIKDLLLCYNEILQCN